jgi:hypothetical protein
MGEYHVNRFVGVRKKYCNARISQKTGVKVGYNLFGILRNPHKHRDSEVMTKESTPLRKIRYRPFESKKVDKKVLRIYVE